MSDRKQIEQAITLQESLRATLGDAMVDKTIAALRQKLSELSDQPPIEQRKQATVLFGDISGYTSIAETMDAEEVKELMNALWSLLDKAITDQGGRVMAHMGDGVMAVWGVQSVREDDPERAIRAGLLMQERLDEFSATSFPAHKNALTGERIGIPMLRLRIGINTGPVILGEVGSTNEYTALGDTINLASRLENAAPIGGILISRDTYRHVRGVFDVKRLEPISIKGKAKPVEVYVVMRAKARTFRLGIRGVEGVETELIGRKAELDFILEALQTVIDDRESRVITVIGEAGLGKSRLLYETNKEIELMPHKVRIFNGRATESARDVPYSLLRDVFCFRFEIQDNDSAEVARTKLENGIVELTGEDDEETRMRAHFIGHVIGFDFSMSPFIAGIKDDTKQIRDRAFHYAKQFFSTTANDLPVMLCLDDLQWADDGSLDMVDYLARSLSSFPLFVICLARPGFLERRSLWGEGQPSHLRLSLQPLSKRASRQLVGEVLQHAASIPQQLRDLVVGMAEGNPFYIEELIKMLIDKRVITSGAEKWQIDEGRLAEIPMPTTLTGVLQARLDGLLPSEKRVLQRAAVVGREFWDGVVEYLGPRSGSARASTTAGAVSKEIDHVLQTLRRKELTYQREMSSFSGAKEYVFKHALLRDVAYESVLIRERRKFHLMAAEWLVAVSGDRVGEYAAIIAHHCERALEIDQAAVWYWKAGHQARETYLSELAINCYSKAIDLTLSKINSVRSIEEFPQAPYWYEGLAEALRIQARFPESIEAYKSMLSLAESQDNQLLQARAWNGLNVVLDRMGDNRAALESGRRAEALARSSGECILARKELVGAILRQSWSLYRLGDTAAALRLGEMALSLCNELADEGRRDQAGES